MRLNAAIRSTIIHGATKALRDRALELEDREHKLTRQCYDIAIPADLAKALGAVEKLHASYFKYEKRVSFNVAGQRVVMQAELPYPVPTAYYAQYSSLGRSITLEKHSKLVEAVRAWQADKVAYESDYQTTERTMKTLLKSVGSTETLFKVWPEGKKFYSTPPLTPIVRTGVPAASMEKLNAMLGLT